MSLFARLQSNIHGLVLDHQEQGRFERLGFGQGEERAEWGEWGECCCVDKGEFWKINLSSCRFTNRL